MNKNKNINNLNIFDKIRNEKGNLIPFKSKKNFLGNKKYFPSISKEWKNSTYVYNKNNIINLPINDLNVNSLIKYYFNLRFVPKFIFKKYKPRWMRRYSMNKIYVSKAEIKHTNKKAIITIYSYNREKIVLLKKIRLLKKTFLKNFILLINNNNEYLEELFTKNSLLYKQLMILRRYKLKLNLNKYKFEEKLLYKLSNIIGKYYNKKIEFNIVNIKSIIYNSDIFTKILAHKVSKKNNTPLRMMKYVLKKALIPKINKIKEKNRLIKNVDIALLENKYKNVHLTSVLESNNTNDLLSKQFNSILYNNSSNKNFILMYNTIFNSINYKNLSGIRLEVKGRLTKRYRADRALYKVKWKGGLRNISSSYKGLSTVKMRGYLNSNVEHSLFISKRRVGAFAVKGWVSGK
jgi:hypothetical protein